MGDVKLSTPTDAADDAPRRRQWLPLALLALLLLIPFLLRDLQHLRLPWGQPGLGDLERALSVGLPEEDPPLPREIRRQVEEALRQRAEGESSASVAILRGALEKAPDSPTLHFLLAEQLAVDGIAPIWESLAHARVAAESAEPTLASRALHGELLALAGLRGEAATVADSLSGEAPETWRDALWMSHLFHDLERPRDLLEVTRRDAPWADHFLVESLLQTEHLWARLALGQREEARELFEELPLDGPERSSLLRYADAYRATVRPAEAARGLIRRDMAVSYPLEDLDRIVALAARTGRIDEARQVLEPWLAEQAAERDEWRVGLAWFDEEQQAAILDRRLAEIPRNSPRAVPPGLIRLSLYGPEEQPEARKLARRLARLDLDAQDAQWVDYFRFATALDEPYYTHLADLRKHVRETPDHPECALLLVDLLSTTQPAAARSWLERLRDGATLDDPWNAMDATLLDLTILLSEDRSEEALAAARRIPRGARGHLHSALDSEQLRAEAAFLAGDEALLEELLALLLRSGDAAYEASALLLRWSDQVVQGRRPTWHRDVEALLARHEELDADEVVSSSLLSILARAGRIDPASLDQRLYPEARATPELVRILAEAANGEGGEGGDLAPQHREALEDIAALPHPGQYGPQLARTILRRRPAS